MTHKLYTELGKWWPLLSPPEDYLHEASFFHEVLVTAGVPPAPTLLEPGAGGGNNAVHLKAHFAQVTLTDLSPQMLAVSRALNPDCEHLLGDMRTLRLGRAFDVVFVHDAIDYMTTHHDLRLALESAFLHCTPLAGWPSSCRITSGRLLSRPPMANRSRHQSGGRGGSKAWNRSSVLTRASMILMVFSRG